MKVNASQQRLLISNTEPPQVNGLVIKWNTPYHRTPWTMEHGPTLEQRSKTTSSHRKPRWKQCRKCTPTPWATKISTSGTKLGVPTSDRQTSMMKQKCLHSKNLFQAHSTTNYWAYLHHLPLLMCWLRKLETSILAGECSPDQRPAADHGACRSKKSKGKTPF